MKLDTFFNNFGLMADAPNGVQKLREMILQLAVQGKLVPQDPKDEPASVLLEKIKAEKERLLKEGKIKKSKSLPSIKLGEIPYEIPIGWEWIRLGEMGFTQTGTTPSKSNPAYFGKYIPFIKPADIFENSVNYENEGLSKQGLKHGRLIESNSVLMVCIGGSIGKVNFIERACSCNQQINTITLYAGILYNLLNYFMRSPYFQNEVVSRASKTTLPIINKGKWELIPTPLPPANEQKRIVTKVDELMALCDELEVRKQQVSANCIQLNDASIHKLLTVREPKKFNNHWQRICDNFDLLYSKPENVTKLRQAVLQLAVQGKLIPQDPKDEPASVLLEKIKAEREQLIKKAEIKTPKPLPSIKPEEFSYELPEGWEWIRLGNITSPDRGVTYGIVKLGPEPDSGGIKTLRCSDVLYRKISTQNARSVRSDISAQYKRTILQGGELLMNIRGTLGGCGIVGEELKGYNIAREVALIPLVKKIESRFILDVISSPYIQINTIQNLRGIAYKGLNLNILKNFLIPIPPLPEQKRIVAKVDELMAFCDELETRLSQSQTDCDRLMEAAVAGILAA